MTISPAFATLPVGRSLALTPQVDVAGSTVATTFSFTSSVPAVATVSSTGLVVALTPGNTTITLSVTGSGSQFTTATKVASASITVTTPVNALGGLTLARWAPDPLVIGQSMTVTPTAQAAGPGVSVSYSYTSSIPSVATVSSTGMVVANAEGTTTIGVTATGSGPGFATTVLTASLAVSVQRPPDAITAGSLAVTHPGSETFVDRTFQLGVSVQAPRTATVVYRVVSTDTAVLRVTPQGDSGIFLVEPLSVGPASLAITVSGSGPGLAATTVGAQAGFVVDALATVDAGAQATCALSRLGYSGNAFCWGGNSRGVLGNGTTTNSAVPVRVAGGRRFDQLSVGGGHACGISNQVIYCWGANTYGQLGDGTLSDRHVPTPVLTTSRFTRVAAGGGHTCGITTSQEVFCWGDNRSGQLGEGSRTPRTLPFRVGSNLAFFELAAGALHSCASRGLSRVGQSTVYCWGGNSFGQLGDGTRTDRLLPVPVPSSIETVHAGESSFHTCARNLAERAFCFGLNGAGQLGDGSRTDRSTPVSVGNSSRAFQVTDSGINHTCGLSGTTVWCWGDDGAGQLGNGPGLQSATTPSLVPLGFIPQQLAVGANHGCVVVSHRTNASQVRCWGSSDQGQLGDGSSGVNVSRHSPVVVTP